MLFVFARRGIKGLNMLSRSTADGCGRYFVAGDARRGSELSAYRVLFSRWIGKLFCVGAC
jgi:hypothetical protein